MIVRPPDALDDELENELRELRSSVAFPATPSLSMTVVERITPAPRHRVPWWSLGRGVVLVGILLVVLAGAAVAVGIGVGGVQFWFVDAPRTPASQPENAAAFGEQVTLSDAREAVDFAVLLPELEALGEPDRVYVAEIPTGGRVMLAYDARPGFPADAETGFAVLITEFRRDIGPQTFAKLINQGVEVTEVTVSGRPGYWIAGGTHDLIYLDDEGREVFEQTRLVGDTLIWEQSGLTLRIENAPSLEAALQVAESME